MNWIPMANSDVFVYESYLPDRLCPCGWLKVRPLLYNVPGMRTAAFLAVGWRRAREKIRGARQGGPVGQVI